MPEAASMQWWASPYGVSPTPHPSGMPLFWLSLELSVGVLPSEGLPQAQCWTSQVGFLLRRHLTSRPQRPHTCLLQFHSKGSSGAQTGRAGCLWGWLGPRSGFRPSLLLACLWPQALLSLASSWPSLLLGSRDRVSQPPPTSSFGSFGLSLPLRQCFLPEGDLDISRGTFRLRGPGWKGLCPRDQAGRGYIWGSLCARQAGCSGSCLGPQGSPRLVHAGSGPPAAPAPAPAWT